MAAASSSSAEGGEGSGVTPFDFAGAAVGGGGGAAMIVYSNEPSGCLFGCVWEDGKGREV